MEPIRINHNALDILGELREGGMARLYKGLDTHDRRIVLRELKPEFRFNFKMRKRFQRGVMIRRAVADQPNVVQYFGEGSRGFRPYEVIELVDGGSLKGLIHGKHKVVWERPLEILYESALAMHQVHAAGFIHMDIKPENYLVNPSAKPVQVKLSDFDLCLPVETEVAPKDFGGSRQYLPPEYFIDKLVGLTTDIFAFGVLAYNLYTFQMPFSNSVLEDMRGRSYEIRFPRNNWTEGRLTPKVEEFICKCLAEKSWDRYQTDPELQQAIIGLK